ncbi:MAG: DUF4242 domain-containing protein [Candidatus Nanopelagicales bacterium]
MPLFIIERHYAEQLDPALADIAEITRVNDDEEVRWLMSFLSADKRKTYCLYEAESAEALLRAAERLGIPADVVTEVTDRILPDGSLTSVV